ncbi:hypothetical protein Y013_26405 (plasmid) [Rhodococcus pyridinivorans SB3094]|uniref:Ribosome modulation factor n=1 Tax=Rhodococcus pyridinivorans SB3094 TaxID=1435356 RepID=V9XSF5_9NOCA|nr:hypothetical protein [Rhodococcus pyridinivorans]AHD24332.1 hypothetical protein Y013_26405 [Rhodococcus pyridinivorans SB3094]
MLDDEDRGYRDGRRAGARFARNPKREPKDPAIPRWVSDPHVYLRFWQEGWVQGMSDPDGTRLRHSPPPIRIHPTAPTPSATEQPRPVKET